MSVDDFIEQTLKASGFKNIAGVDESGYGCFAGSVYVGAVIFPTSFDYAAKTPGLDDSKKKTAKQREVLYELIKKHCVSCSFGFASVKEIDEMNIYHARFLAARRAMVGLSVAPDFILMDGNQKITEIKINQQAVIKGDTKSISIAAASIIAKVERDKHIESLAELVHEDYGWKSNKSYYSKSHVEAIKKHGKTKWHREKYVRKYLKGN